MKKIRILFAIVASLIVLQSCGSTDSNSETNYQVTITAIPSEGGSVSPTSGKYRAGEKLNIKATPTDGWQFDNWSGDYQGTSSAITITVTKDMNICNWENFRI